MKAEARVLDRDAAGAGAAYERGVLVEDAAWHWARRDRAPSSIVLGYGSLTEPVIRRGVAVLAEAIDAMACAPV